MLVPPLDTDPDAKSGGRRVTVAHVVQNLQTGGLERVVINLMRGVNRLDYRSILFILGEGGKLVDELEQDGLEFVALNKKPGMDYRLFGRMARHFKREVVDVVHAHNFSPLVYGAVAGRLSGASGVVYTAHGVKTSGRRKQSLFQRFRLVDKMVFVSDDARSVAVERGGVAVRNILTIVNGVDLDRYSVSPAGDRETKRREVGISPGAEVVGIVARLTPAKDHSNLFRAFKRVLSVTPGARLLVVGDGELRGELEAEVIELGVQGEVIFLGDRSDVPDLLGIMDVFVLSSYTEGLAMTLLEAMAAGLPIVATRVGGNTEAVVDGQTGFIVPPRDERALAGAVLELLEDKERAREMGRMGRARAVEKFGTDTMVREYEKLYRSVLR